MKIETIAPSIKSQIPNNLHRKILFLLLVLYISALPVYAQPDEQPRRILPINRNLQDLRRNNLVIHRLNENITVPPDTIAGNVTEFTPNQTYIVRSNVKRITSADQTMYRNMDRELKKEYSPSDIKMLPETYIQTGSTTNNQTIYKIGFESKLPLEYYFESGQ